jgi:micrococcal nuclease
VVDGDTIDVVLDLGKRTYAEDRLRLLNVNAPERKGATLAAGNASRDYVVEWLPDADSKEWPLRVQTFKDDVFGRYLALVWRVSDGACLNDDLITSGMARVDIR